MFVKENIYLSNKARSTIRRTFTKEKKFPDKRDGGGEPPGPTSKSALVNNMCNVALPRSFTYVLSCFLSFLKNLYKSLLTSVFYVDLVCSWSILRDCSCHYTTLDCFIIRFFTVISFPYNQTATYYNYIFCYNLISSFISNRFSMSISFFPCTCFEFFNFPLVGIPHESKKCPVGDFPL